MVALFYKHLEEIEDTSSEIDNSYGDVSIDKSSRLKSRSNFNDQISKLKRMERITLDINMAIKRAVRHKSRLRSNIT